MNIGDKRLIEHVYTKVRPIFDDVLIISRNHDSIEGVDAPVFGDVLLHRGPLVGIVSALLHAQTTYVFAVACDMPFLDESLIRSMIDQIHGEDIIIPKTSAGYEALHAIYHRSCLSPMLRLIDRGRFKVRDIFPFVSVSFYEVEGIAVFTNLNTKEDVDQVRHLL